jgi:FixJ family two-component response regulator
LDEVKVLIASGVDMTKRSNQEGADGFILKPFMPDELIREIQKTLE